MKCKTLGLLLGVLFLFGAVSAQADVIYVSGNVSGFWWADTVAVTGEVSIPEGLSLTILPGVKVLFQVYCKFIVETNATLIAVGTETDSIRFDEFSAGVHWNGIRFYISSDASRMEYCYLANGQAPVSGFNGNGGAIFIDNSSPTIRHCTITGNRAATGGGISCNNSDAYIGQNDISYNWTLANPYYYGLGGGIRCDGGSPTITENIIHHNDANRAGGIIVEYSNASISFNVIHSNTAAWYTALDFLYSTSNYSPSCINNTICGNTATNGPGGIAVGQAQLTLKNCIIWGNSGVQVYEPGSASISYCDIQGGMAGIGNINQDPLFVNASAGDFHLLEDSPCIDNGDPHSPLDPDSTRADMGAFYFDQGPRLTVALEPHNLPIIIPAGGGSFRFDITVSNNDTVSHTVDISTYVTLPSGSPYPILNRSNITMAPGSSIVRPNLTQMVPGSALPGYYRYYAYLRDHVTWETYDQDSFPFEKLYGYDAPAHDHGWALWGWDEANNEDSRMPAIARLSLRPNPFNARTEISYLLPRSSLISLTILNASGRHVAELCRGWREAGAQSLTFDASALSSGLYLVHLRTDELGLTQKLLLLK